MRRGLIGCVFSWEHAYRHLEAGTSHRQSGTGNTTIGFRWARVLSNAAL